MDEFFIEVINNKGTVYYINTSEISGMHVENGATRICMKNGGTYDGITEGPVEILKKLHTRII